MTRTIRWLCVLGAASTLTGCAGMLSWDSPSRKTVYTPPPPPTEPVVVPQRPVGPTDYMVVKGDTLYSIAFRNNLDYRDVARWNDVGPGYLIMPGQVLRLTPPTEPRPVNGEIATAGIDVMGPGKPKPLGGSAMPAPKPLPTTASADASPLATPASSLPPVVASADAGVATVSAAPDPAAKMGNRKLIPYGSSGYAWQWPVDGVVVRGFSPDNGAKGLDFGAKLGSTVYAAAPGRVVYSGSALKGYGELIIIKHDDLRLSAYGYNSKRLVKEGDLVAGGQPIAQVGLGPENKPILHFEIREKGSPVNPVPYLPARAEK